MITDTSFVLDNLDATNKKALYRRAFANKSQQKYQEAIRDFQAYEKHHGKESEITTALNQCMKLLVEKNKRDKEEEAKRQEELRNKPKIQEVEPPAFKRVEIEEDSEDSDDEAEAAKAAKLKRE